VVVAPMQTALSYSSFVDTRFVTRAPQSAEVLYRPRTEIVYV
jgi:hypothetical protein